MVTIPLVRALHVPVSGIQYHVGQQVNLRAAAKTKPQPRDQYIPVQIYPGKITCHNILALTTVNVTLISPQTSCHD